MKNIINKKIFLIIFSVLFLSGGFFANQVLSVVIPTELLSISITSPAEKLIYHINDELDTTGLEVIGKYVHLGEEGPLPAGDFPIEITTANIFGFDSSVPVVGQELTITYQGKTTIYTIDVIAPTLKDIYIDESSTHKTTYYVGDELDITGLMVMGKYVYQTDDGETNFGDFPIEITKANIFDFNSSIPTTGQVLTIKYEDKVVFYNVDILEKPVLKLISITNPADKLTYEVGEVLNTTGLEVTAKYVYLSEDGEIPAEDSIIDIADLAISGFDSTTPVDGQILTISFEDKTTEYTIDIEEKLPVLKLIIISNPADKLVYYVGDTLDITGLEITGKYVYLSEDGEIPAEDKILAVIPANISGFDSSVPVEEQVLTIEIEEKTTTYSVKILANQSSGSSSGGGSGGLPNSAPITTKTGDANNDGNVDELDFSLLMANI